MSDSDSDGIPELVPSSTEESSEDEDDTMIVQLEKAEKWLQRGSVVLKKEDTWFRVFCLGPFLYGVDSIVPKSWIQALDSAKLLLNDKRKHSVSFLEWKEWEYVDLLDAAIEIIQTSSKHPFSLARILNLINEVESCINKGNSDEVDCALQSVCTLQHVVQIWNSLSKNDLFSKRERAAKFAVLYAMKVYSNHVLDFEFVDKTKKKLKELKKTVGGKSADDFKREGNAHFKLGELEKSIDCYTEAAKKDPFHHVYYGNRAIAYNKLKKYMEALADGRRAVTIKPDFAKGYHRYATAFYELGRLDSAISVTKLGIDQCEKARDIDVSNLQELKVLRDNYLKKQMDRDSKNNLTPIPKDLDEQLSLFTSDNIDLEEKFGVKRPPIHIESIKEKTPTKVTSESDSEMHPKQVEQKSKKKNKSKQKSKLETDMKRKDIISDTTKEKHIEIAKKMAEVEEALKLYNDAEMRKNNERKELMMYLSDGSDSIIKKADKNAMISYQKALDMLAHHEQSEDLGLDEADVVTLKYAFATAAISTGLYKNIMEGIEKFQEIIQQHPDVRFPPAYLGLGKAYITLNRYPQACEYLNTGKKIAEKVSFVHVTWPGSKNLVDETDPTILVKHIEELLERCKFTPQPDAVCRYHIDPADDRKVIYVSDPDFKGYIKITCQMACIVTFHTNCWKTYKTNAGKQLDKDMLDTTCPTPDCVGLVIKIEIIRQDSLSKMHISEKNTELKDSSKAKSKPQVKQKPGESKLTKKHEKKEIRKQKKRQYQEGKEEMETTQAPVIVDGASASAFVEELIAETQPLPDVKDTVVYKKEEPAEKPQTKSKKSKKKRDRTKNVINLEVNFSDRREETLLNENSTLSDEEKPKSLPFSVPNELKSQISNFEKTYSGSAKPQFKPDEITENLFSFFVDILQATGPLAIDDQKIQQELDVFPSQALEKIKQVGGLADFLRQSLKFAVIDDVVSLMSDAKAAREYALKRRAKLNPEIGVEKVTKSAWKTVGRNANSVDGLKESVIGSTNIPTVSNSPPTFSGNPPEFETESDIDNTKSQYLDPSLPSSTNTPRQTQTVHKSWASFVKSTPSPTPLPPKSQSSSIDALDSIDDIPLVGTKTVQLQKHLDNLDDFETVSDSGVEKKTSKSSALDKKVDMKYVQDIDTISSSSSRSDLSESFKSDFSSESMPKPLRPLGGFGRSFGLQKSTHMWDKLENDFDVSWKKSKKEEFSEPLSVENVGDEVRQAAEEFVRKSDEKFVSELAESVVEKLYNGKTVSEDEKQVTFQKVSTDIWKDFEKSAKSGDMWANTPAGGDYSTNMGKFAHEFMKKHYENADGTVSPDLKTVYPSKLISPMDSFNLSHNSSKVSSPISPSWSTEDPTSKIITPPSHNSPVFPPPQNPSPSPSINTSANFSSGLSGYDLFSGPSWGFNSFSKPTQSTPSSMFTNPSPQAFVRPPHPASSFYQSSPFAVPPGPLPYPPPFQMPIHSVPPPPLNKAEKLDIGVQCVPTSCRSIETMTDPYEPFKQQFLAMKEERDQAVRLMTESKDVYEALVNQYQIKDQQVKALEKEMSKEINKYTTEKKQALEDKDTLNTQIQKLNGLVSNKDQAMKELRDKVDDQEKRVNDLALLAKEQREKDLLEMTRYKELADLLQEKHLKQWDRASSAEIELLKNRLHIEKTSLTRSQKEAAYHIQNLGAIIKKHKEDNKTPAQLLQKAGEYWSSVHEKAEEGLKTLQAEYDSRIEELRGGKLLSELQPVRVPSLPPMPDSLKIMAGHVAAPGSTGPVPPRVSPPTGGLPSSQGSAAAGNTGANNFPALPSPVPGAGNMPRPRNQWPASSPTSAVPPKPLSGARAPLAAANRSPLRPLGGVQPQMSSFDKLILRLQAQFPGHSRSDFTGLIQELRRERGGSLSGMTMEDIIGRVDQLMRHKQPQAERAVKPMQAPPGLNPSWAFQVAGGKREKSAGRSLELFEDEVDPCVICHEEMAGKTQSTVTLECNHKFHDECIRKWFQEQSTCPNCRVHTLLADEFPSLG